MPYPRSVRIAWLFVGVAMPLLLWHAWCGKEWRIPSYHAPHTLLEVISVSTSLMVAVAALVPGEHTRPLLPGLGAGFLAVALLDLFHLLSFPIFRISSPSTRSTRASSSGSVRATRSFSR